MVSKNVNRESCQPPAPMKSHHTADLVSSKPARGAGESRAQRQEAAALLLTLASAQQQPPGGQQQQQAPAGRWPVSPSSPTRRPALSALPSGAGDAPALPPAPTGPGPGGLMSQSARSLGMSLTASSIVDQGEYFFDDDFSVPFDANLREENNNTTDADADDAFDSDGEGDGRRAGSSRSDPNLTSSLLFTSAEAEADAGPLWSDEQRSEEDGDAGSGSFLSTSGGDAEPGSDPSPAVASLLRRPMRGEYRLTYVGPGSTASRRSVGASASASMEFQISATTSGGTAADSECSSGSNLSTWASLARSNSPAARTGCHTGSSRTQTQTDSSAPSTLRARPQARMTTWSQVRSSSRESLTPSRPADAAPAAGSGPEEASPEAGGPGRVTTWKQMKRVASAKFVSWRELKEVVRVAPEEAPAAPIPAAAAPTGPPRPDASPTAVQMRAGRAALQQSAGEPAQAVRSRSADQRNRYSGTLLELFKRSHAYDGGAGASDLTAPAPGQAAEVNGPLRRSLSISPVRAQPDGASPAEWFGRLFSDNSLSPVCSFEANAGPGWQGRRAAGAKEYRHFGAQFPPAMPLPLAHPLPAGVKLRPRSQSQQNGPVSAIEQVATAAGVSTPGKQDGPSQPRRASTGQTAAPGLNKKRITYPNVHALKVPLPAKSKRLVSSAWGPGPLLGLGPGGGGGGGSGSQSLMALPDLSFLSRHLTRLKEQEAAGPGGAIPKLRRSNSCAASVNRNPGAAPANGSADSPPDSGINTSADSIPVAYDLIQLDGEPGGPGPGPAFRARPASSEPDLLTADLSSLIGPSKGSGSGHGGRKAGAKPLKPCLVRPRANSGSGGEMAASATTTASSSSDASSGGAACGPGTGEFRAKKSVSFSEKILFHQAPAKGQGRSRPLSLVDNLRVIPHKVGLYGDEELFMAYAPVCSPETSPVKESGPALGERPNSEVDRRYQALVAEVIQAVHRMVAHFTGDAPSPAGPPMSALLPPLSTLVCDGLNAGGGRAAGLFAKFRNRLWPVVEESCRQGVSHRVLSEVLREVKALPGITTEKTKFKAFACACLNAKCLPMWLNAVASNESLLRRHFCEDAFLRQAGSSQRELFADLITSLELLLGLPFRLDVAAEAKRASHTPPGPSSAPLPAAGPPPGPPGQQPVRARHDIKVKQHQPLHSASPQPLEAKGRWRHALGMGAPAPPGSSAAPGKGPAPKTRIPVGTGARGGSPAPAPGLRRGESSPSASA